jgi:hypothetical protein
MNQVRCDDEPDGYVVDGDLGIVEVSGESTTSNIMYHIHISRQSMTADASEGCTVGAV